MASSKEAGSPREVFQRLFNGVTSKKWAELPELYAEDAVVRHPFLPGSPVLRGRADLRAHFAVGARLRFDMRAEGLVLHQTVDPEVVIGEFRYVGEFTDSGRAFDMPNIFVMRVRDGLIVAGRDYADHASFAAAAGTWASW
jgi:ketosteroid isomerase-like protein